MVNSNNSSDALIILDTCKTTLNYLVQTINENEDHKKISDRYLQSLAWQNCSFWVSYV